MKVCAQVHNIPVFQPTKLRDGTALETIRQLEPDLIVVAAYGRILPQEILDYPRLGCVNVHSSLLPKYRGAAPIHWAILNGEQETGVTLMHMALALDAGDIIAQRATPIDPDETVEELHDRLARAGGGPPGRDPARPGGWHRHPHPPGGEPGHPGPHAQPGPVPHGLYPACPGPP